MFWPPSTTKYDSKGCRSSELTASNTCVHAPGTNYLAGAWALYAARLLFRSEASHACCPWLALPMQLYCRAAVYVCCFITPQYCPAVAHAYAYCPHTLHIKPVNHTGAPHITYQASEPQHPCIGSPLYPLQQHPCIGSPLYPLQQHPCIKPVNHTHHIWICTLPCSCTCIRTLPCRMTSALLRVNWPGYCSCWRLEHILQEKFGQNLHSCDGRNQARSLNWIYGRE